MTRDVPGLLIRSVFPDNAGDPILPAGTFLVYGLFASAALLFVLVFVRETKGRTLEELEGELLSRPKTTAA